MHKGIDYLFRINGDTIQQVINAQPDAWYGDSVLHLNRIVGYDSAANYYSQFLPCFIGTEIYTHGNTFTITEKTPICLVPSTPIGITWLYDTAQNITAQVSAINATLIFSQPDSVMTISLSNGDSILLSKLYGLISFPIKYNRQVSVIGVRDSVCHGECIPNTLEMLDFEVTDVFMYKASDFSYEEAPSTTTHNTIEYRKRIITSKTVFADSTVYESLVLQRNEHYTNSVFDYYTQTTYNEPFTVMPNSGDIVSAIPYTPTPVNFITNFGWPYGLFSYLAATTNYRVTDVTKTDLGQYQKTNSSLYCLPGDTFVQFNNSSPDRKVYTEHLGLTYYYAEGFESGWHEVEQLGYVHNGIVHGTVFQDNEVVSAIEKNSFDDIAIYPMPASEFLSVKGAVGFDISLMNLYGDAVAKRKGDSETRLNIEDLVPGTYFLRFNDSHNFYTKAVIIAR
ncbi:MAG: T9SS type A sorting domain-containing protein [Chitinophagales bacterium]